MEMEREKTIEKKLMRRVKDAGGLCLKLNSPSMDGLPDRMILMPGGKLYFAEIKKTGKLPRRNQVAALEKLTRLGFTARVVDSTEGVRRLMEEMGHG